VGNQQLTKDYTAINTLSSEFLTQEQITYGLRLHQTDDHVMYLTFDGDDDKRLAVFNASNPSKFKIQAEADRLMRGLR